MDSMPTETIRHCEQRLMDAIKMISGTSVTCCMTNSCSLAPDGRVVTKIKDLGKYQPRRTAAFRS